MNVVHLYPKARPAIIDFLIADYKQTRRDLRYATKLVKEYFYFRSRGFSAKAAWWNARNTI